MEERGGGEVKWSEEMDKHGETTSRLSKRIRWTDGAHYITRWPMDRDGCWNRGRGHARVSGDCSHWLENQGETGRNVTGIRWAGREQGLTDVHQRFSIHNYAYHPVHNNFDRVIIAFFGAKQVFPKNTLSWDDDFQPFFRIDWRESHLFLFVLLFFAPIFSISFNCEILSFFLSSSPRFHHFISSFSGFNAWLHFSSFLPFSHDLFHPPFPSPLFHHNFLSFLLPRSKLSTKLQSPVKGFYSPTLFDHVYLPSIPSTPSFPFSHTFEKTRNSPEQIFNSSYLSLSNPRKNLNQS